MRSGVWEKEGKMRDGGRRGGILKQREKKTEKNTWGISIVIIWTIEHKILLRREKDF